MVKKNKRTEEMGVLGRCIVSIATIPSRVHFLKPVLLPLLGEGVPIYVWLAGKLERKDEVWDGVKPLWTKELDVSLSVVKDHGPITKLLAALETSADTIVTLDDDVIFDKGAIRNLLSWAMIDPNAAYCYRGRDIKKGQPYNQSKLYKNVQNSVRVNMVTGVRGCVYSAKFFDGWEPNYKDHWMVDDIVISAHLHNNKTPMYVVPNWGKITNHFTYRIQGLYSENNAIGNENNDKAINDLYAWE